MVSPAQRHFMRACAAKVTALDAPPAHATQYELMLAKLADDKRRLKQVQSIERKADVKRELLPEYAPWVDGVLQAAGERAAGTQDDVLMTVLVWRIDVGDFAGALPIAAHALAHGLVLPDQYKRGTACLIAEECADMALKARTAGAPLDTDSLLAVEQLTREHDMPDEVRAKLHKAIGYGLTGSDPAEAVANLRRALELHKDVGVKKDIEKLERELKHAAEAATARLTPREPRAGRQGAKAG